MPRLSVVLPVKDGQAHLPRALTSTLAALPRDGELVVVDDGSTDATPAILDAARTRDRRVRVLVNEAPTGVALALNRGIGESDSEFVGRMDADDVCLPGRFATQLLHLRTTDFVFGSSVLIDGRGRPSGISTPTPVHPVAARFHLLIGNYFSHPTMSCRRSAITSVGGYTKTLVEDYELWLRAAAAGLRLRQTPAPVLGYRRHAASITGAWRPPTDDPVLDAAYGALLPEPLRDATAVLRHSAVTRLRESTEEREAGARLRAWLEPQAATLGALDRLVLRRRIGRLPVG